MKIRLPRHLSLALFSCGVFASQGGAVTFDFTEASDYTDNFRNTFTTSGSSGTLTTNAGAIVHTTNASGTAISAYDTTPDTTVSNLFTTVTVEFDFSTTVSNTSFGVYFGGTTRTNASLALFNINNNVANDQLRIFNGADWNLVTGVNGSTSSPAAAITLNSTTASSGINNGWTINTTYHAVFNVTYTDATTANVSFTISDPSSNLASVSVTASGLTLAASGGEIALRTGFASSGGALTIDNVQINTPIPEPSAFALLGGLGALGLAVMKRRRAA